LRKSPNLDKVVADAAILVGHVKMTRFLLIVAVALFAQCARAQSGTLSVTGIGDNTPLLHYLYSRGNFNGDGGTDGLDLVNWRRGAEMDVYWYDPANYLGDADLDWQVTGNDFLIWQRNVSWQLTWDDLLRFVPTATQRVPEPTGAAISFTAAIAFGMVRRRRAAGSAARVPA
jgi:hypothetical protein